MSDIKSDIIIVNENEVAAKKKAEHDGYEFSVKKLLPRSAGRGCVASIYEIPPGKSAYPYHYHTQSEEMFYILQGVGELRTPDGVREVAAGEFIYFPADSGGAHKLRNTSECNTLVYLDIDTCGKIDVTVYPDSDKLGIWGCEINKLFRVCDEVDYYDGEQGDEPSGETK